MKKMNKKGFTLVELLAVIVILAILMAIAVTNLGPVIDNSRRGTMRTTAQMILSAVQSQLTSSFQLHPGYYQWDEGILDSGGTTAPFGGTYKYHESGGTKYGSGVYKMDGAAPTCGANVVSYVTISRDDDGKYSYYICLTTTTETYLAGDRTKVDNTDDTSIFYGEAAVKQ